MAQDSASKRWLTRFFVAIFAVAAFIIPAKAMVIISTSENMDFLDDISAAFAYLVIFACVFGDAVIPLLPGETVVNAASVMAAQGELEIVPVMIAASAGAVLGDSALYWIARLASHRLAPQVERLEQDSRVQRVQQILGDRAPLFLVLGRYVPGVRFFVNASMGLQAFPYRRFLLWSAIGGIIWGVYTALLAYWVGNKLSDYPIASFFISGGITTAIIVGVFWWDARRRPVEAASIVPRGARP